MGIADVDMGGAVSYVRVSSPGGLERAGKVPLTPLTVPSCCVYSFDVVRPARRVGELGGPEGVPGVGPGEHALLLIHLDIFARGVSVFVCLVVYWWG